jgi:ParB family chromosome partitioning protein
MGTAHPNSCSDPKCYAAKLENYVRQTIASKPKLVQISTGYGKQQEGSTTIPRNKYVEVRQEKPRTKEEATRPEFKTCKYTTEAIVSEGSERGELRKVCAQADCPVHHPKKQTSTHEPKWNVEEQKRRREEALAQATGLRTLAAIVAAVPVRLMKRDLLFVVERLAALLDERRLEIVARQRGIKKAKDSDSIGKLFTSYLRHAEESALGGLLVEITILHAATKQNAAQVLHDATTAYKVDVDAISLKVKQEFAAKEKAKLAPKPAAKAIPPKARKAA